MDITQQTSTSNISLSIENVIFQTLNSAQRILDVDTMSTLKQFLQGYSQNEDDNLPRLIQNVMQTFLNQIDNMKQLLNLYMSNEEGKQLKLSDYCNLEKVLQKSEDEVRKHIRLQQQLKIYMDGLQDKNQNLQRQVALQRKKYDQLLDVFFFKTQSIRFMDSQRKQLHKKIKILQTKLKDEHKFISHKGSKVMSQASIQQISSAYLSSVQKNGFGKKNKLFDKSVQKPRKLESRQSNYKIINNSIKVDLKQQHRKLLTETEFKQQNKTIQINNQPKKFPRRIIKKTQDDRSLIIGRKNARCLSVLKG